MLPGLPVRRSPRVRSRRALSLYSTKGRLDLAGPRVLDEAVFRDLLFRERERTDRFEHPFIVLLVEAPRADALTIAALAAAKRKTDVVGRLETGIIGVFLPDVRASEAGPVRERFARRLREAFARRSNGAAAGALPIRVHVHAEPIGAAADESCGADPADPIVFSVRSARRTVADTIKRGLDIALSAALLVLLSPLFLLIAALVKLRSRGPVIYEQTRIGQNLQALHDAEVSHDVSECGPCPSSRVRQLVHQRGPAGVRARRHPHSSSSPTIRASRRSAHLLRRPSLDELPQLWNVLRGDMSLVGPRPPLPYELEQYKPWHWRRVLDAKPGLTGLWQVTGRSRTTFDEMVRLDLRYAKRCSLWTDIKILLATPAAVIVGEGRVLMPDRGNDAAKRARRAGARMPSHRCRDVSSARTSSSRSSSTCTAARSATRRRSAPSSRFRRMRRSAGAARSRATRSSARA